MAGAVAIVNPAPRGLRNGNWVTAMRWAGVLRRLGCRVRVEPSWSGRPCDVLVALHARRTHDSIARFAAAYPRVPLLVALTGTDVYADLASSAEARASVALASRLICLQERAVAELPVELRPRARVILQSASPAPPAARSGDCFEVCVLGHLRAVKDPFLIAAAAARLPASSRIAVRHVGRALDAGAADQARAWEARTPRYRWLGERRRGLALRLLAASDLMVLTSRLEGGANVVSEAVVASVPVLSTRIPGSIGLLGADYPGYFPVGDAGALAELLLRAEREGAFLAELRRRGSAVAGRFEPAREREAWQRLLAELGVAP